MGFNVNEYRELQVSAMHESTGHPTNGSLLNSDLLDLRLLLISEEWHEFQEAVADYYANPVSENKEDLLKELADLAYVVSGFAVAFNLPLGEAFDRVHNSNMSKVQADGKVLYREDGKILKGPNYQPPDLSDLVSN